MVGVHDADLQAPVPRLLHSLGTALGPSALAADPTGRFLVVACAAANRALAFAIGEDGGLRQTAQAAVPPQPRHVAFDPSGRFAFVACADADVVAAFQIDRATGALIPIELRHTLRRPVFLAPHPSGLGLLACCEIQDAASLWWVDPRTGRLGTRVDAPLPAAPAGASFGPDGLELFVASRDAGVLGHFVLDPVRQTLAARAQLALDEPLAVVTLTAFR
jgi:hypothetical protein